MSKVLERIEKLGLDIPESVMPVANYAPYVVSGNNIIVSGQLPFDKDGSLEASKGKVGLDFDTQDGKKIARLCAINMVSQVLAAAGDKIDKVRCLKIVVFVNTVEGYSEYPGVANGASDLLGEVFGKEQGKHARSAVGVAGLPYSVAVEVEGLFEILE